MGVYVCRVQFKNNSPAGDYPVIGSIAAKFTHYDGSVNNAQKAVSIRPGQFEYLFSNSTDDAAAECVERVDMTASWLYEDGSADTATVTDSVPHGQCRTVTGCEIDPSGFVHFGFEGTHPPVNVYVLDSSAPGGKRLAWSSEQAVTQRSQVQEMKKRLLGKE